MLDWFRALLPKEDRFFALFDRHAHTIVAAAAALQELLEGGDSVPRCCGAIARQEEAADEITREVLLAVRRTFITPFDRSDIQTLITSLDDAIDQMQKTAKAIQLFEVAQFAEPMRDMGKIIGQAAKVIDDAIPLLRSLGQNSARLNSLTEEVIALEGRADDTHERGLKALYLASRSDPMTFIVGSEIFDHLERVMDRLEDVANRISSILVEHL